MWSTVKNIEIYTMNDDAITDKKGKWKLDSHVMARWWQQQWHQLILVMTGKQTLKHLKIQSDRRVRTLFPLPLSALSLGRFNIPSWCCRTKIDFNFLLWRSFAFAVGLFFTFWSIAIIFFVVMKQKPGFPMNFQYHGWREFLLNSAICSRFFWRGCKITWLRRSSEVTLMHFGGLTISRKAKVNGTGRRLRIIPF